MFTPFRESLRVGGLVCREQISLSTLERRARRARQASSPLKRERERERHPAINFLSTYAIDFQYYCSISILKNKTRAGGLVATHQPVIRPVLCIKKTRDSRFTFLEIFHLCKIRKTHHIFYLYLFY